MNEEAQSDLLQEHEVLFLDFMGCDNDRLFIDTDGKRCLDYIGEMMLLAENQQGDARVWARQSLAEIEARTGATSDAVGILRRLLSIPAGEAASIARLKIDPVWDPIRNDPGFQQLLAGTEHIGP